MAKTLQEIRKQYPQYDDMSDAELVDRLHEKFYSDMERAEFYKRIGFDDAVRTDESGQNVVDVDAVRANVRQATPSKDVGGAPEPEYVGDPMDWLVTSAAKGGSKLLRGTLSFVPDLIGLDETGKEVRQTIPKVEGGQKGTETAGTILQYGIPAGIGFRAATGAAKAAKAGKKGSYTAGLTGAAAGDTTAAIPEETVTVGDMMGGPTQQEPDDTSLTRRVKTGAETLAVGPLADIAVDVGRGVVEAFTGNRMRSLLADQLRRRVKETGEDPEEVARRLDEAAERSEGPEQAGYKPTTGTASDNQALLGTERGVSNQPRITQRFQENRQALTDEALQAVQTSGDPEDARRFFAEQYEGPTRAAEEALEEAQTRLEEARSELGLTASRAREKGTQADIDRASGQIDETAQERLVAATARKNKLFDEIDPASTKNVNQREFRETVDLVTKPLSRGDINPIPSDIRDTIKQMADEGGVTFAELNDLRPRVSGAIRQAREAGEGGVQKRLEYLRGFMNDQAERLAAKNDPKAQEALRFYKEEFVPEFGQGAGARFRKNVRTGKNEPSQTGKTFLLGPTEGAQQLRSILENSSDPQSGIRAAEDFLSSQLAKRLQASSDQNAGQAAKRFIDDYSGVLNEFPELKSRLKETQRELTTKGKKVSGLTESVRRKKAELRDTQREQNKDAARYFFDNDPVKAVERVFASGQPAKKMAELRNKAQGNPSALKGLRAAVKDYIDGALTNASAGENVAATVNRVNKAFNNDRLVDTLKKIYTPEEVNRLKKVQNRLNEMSRIDQRVTQNSITSQLSQDSERARIILSSLYGIVQGRGLFAIGNWLGNQLRGGETMKDVANRVVQDAMLDPKLASTMLKRDSEKARRELRAYISNNYPEMLSDESSAPSERNESSSQPQGRSAQAG